MLRTAFWYAALVIVSTCLVAEIPKGWRALNSVSKPPATMAEAVVRDGKCTIAVPKEWVDDRTVDRSQAHSADGRVQAFVQEWPSGPEHPSFLDRKNQTLRDYRNQRANAQRVYGHDAVDLKVLADTPTSLQIMRTTAATPGGAALTDWTLMAAGNPICYAIVKVSIAGLTSSPADRTTAQQWSGVAEKIVATFKPAK
jgi:hypothetical protein